MKFEEALESLKEGKKVRRKLDGDVNYYITFDKSGCLLEYVARSNKWFEDTYLLSKTDILAEDWEEYKEPLLTDEEKEFLKMVVKMTPYKIGSIELKTNSSTNHDFLVIFGTNGLLIQSKFYVGSYFSNLEIDKVYTLKELGLND